MRGRHDQGLHWVTSLGSAPECHPVQWWAAFQGVRACRVLYCEDGASPPPLDPAHRAMLDTASVRCRPRGCPTVPLRPKRVPRAGRDGPAGPLPINVSEFPGRCARMRCSAGSSARRGRCGPSVWPTSRTACPYAPLPPLQRRYSPLAPWPPAQSRCPPLAPWPPPIGHPGGGGRGGRPPGATAVSAFPTNAADAAAAPPILHGWWHTSLKPVGAPHCTPTRSRSSSHSVPTHTPKRRCSVGGWTSVTWSSPLDRHLSTPSPPPPPPRP